MQGLKGLLCFPCRFKFDEIGGEQFLIDSEKYVKESAAWNARYGNRWIIYQKLKKLSDAAFTLLVLNGIFCIISTVITSGKALSNFWPVFLIIFVIGLIARLSFSTAATRHLCPLPPQVPSMDLDALNSKPEIALDFSCACDGNSDCVNYQNGYPPDWSERKALCLKRDGHRCCICFSKERLHIHHVKPISFGGTHTLQNLITLCSWCHMRQRYYAHRRLVENNIRAKKKYWVEGFSRSDGVTVKGHSRRVGRRGNFWKSVRLFRKKST